MYSLPEVTQTPAGSDQITKRLNTLKDGYSSFEEISELPILDIKCLKQKRPPLKLRGGKLCK